MTDYLSLHKLVKTSTARKVPFKTFLALYNELNTKQPVQDNEYSSELLEFNEHAKSLSEKKTQEYQVYLAIQVSLSSTEELKRFWSNLSKIHEANQVVYLIRLNKLLKYEYSKYDKDLLRTLIKCRFRDYLIDVLSKYNDSNIQEAQLALVNHIVFFGTSVIEHVVIKDEALVKEVAFKLASHLKRLKLASLLDFLLSKTKNILSDDQIHQLIHSKTNSGPGNAVGSADEKSSDLPIITSSSYKSLSISSLSANKQESYHETTKFFWINTVLKSWKLGDNESFLNNFVHNFIPGSDLKNKNPYVTAFELIKSTFKGIGYAVINNDDCYMRFNWKNFIISRIPVILSNLKFTNANDEETLEKAVLNAFNALPDSIIKVLVSLEIGSSKPYDLRQIFIKSLIFNRLLPPIAFQKFFPMESKISQQVILQELAQYSYDLNLRRKFNEKLINVNSEFTSLEESGLIEFCNSLPPSLEYSYKRQLELSSVIGDIIDEMKIAREPEKLNRLLLAILNNVQLLNIIAFNGDPYVFLGKLIDHIDSENFSIDEDDENFQDSYSYCGVLILAVITIVEKFKIDLSKVCIKKSFTIDYINNFYYRLCDNLTDQVPVNSDEEDNTIATNYNNLLIDWINALFDDSNDGLSDDLIKSINIKQIYKVIPLVYQQAIIATDIGKIDIAILTNGIDYLSQVFLVPTTASIINWLLREISSKRSEIDSLPIKVLSEIIKSNTSSDSLSKELSSLVFKIIINITGSNILMTLKKIKDWESNQRIKYIVDIVSANLDSNYIERDISLPENKKDININEEIKAHLVNFQQQTESPSPVHPFVHNFISQNRTHVLKVLLAETASFQKSNNESTKIFINLASFLLLITSIRSPADKAYWRNTLTNEAIKSERKVFKSSDKEFNLSMDFHYSSIFNDSTNNSHSASTTTKVDNDDPISFLKDDDDDLMGDEDDLFNDKSLTAINTTSKLLEEVRTKINRNDNLLWKFNSIRIENHDSSNPWSKTLSILTDKLVDELNGLYM